VYDVLRVEVLHAAGDVDGGEEDVALWVVGLGFGGWVGCLGWWGE
jgi:hypothetical protein